ncbi:MAG: DUF6596 domain-containing protein [Burkholderiales bacterium]
MLGVVNLVFNEVYAATETPGLTRPDLCAEAIRLARLPAELVPQEPEVIGLLALMLLHDARRAMAEGPERGLAWIAHLENREELSGYHLLHAARADRLRRLGPRSRRLRCLSFRPCAGAQ